MDQRPLILREFKIILTGWYNKNTSFYGNIDLVIKYFLKLIRTFLKKDFI